MRVLPLSGKSDKALRELAERYLGWLDERASQLSGADAGSRRSDSARALLSDMTYTAGVGRSHFARRAGLVFADTDSLRDGLNAIARMEVGSDLRRHRALTLPGTELASIPRRRKRAGAHGPGTTCYETSR